MEEDPSSEASSPLPVLKALEVLEAFKQASHDLQTHPRPDPDDSNSNSAAAKALLELETVSDHILSKDPNLCTLTHHLSDLKALIDTLHKTRGYGLRSFLARRASAHSISRVAASIQDEIQSWIDRESVENLTRALREPVGDEDELVKQLGQFENRVLQGFDRDLQDLVLKSNVFSTLESIICNPKCSKRIREESAYAVAALIRFNKDVFVGLVLMGPTVHALIEIGSWNSIQVLCSLIKSTKSPLVDGIESNGEIPRIISFLNNEDLEMRVMGMDCVLEIGYFGRKEAIEAMLNEGLVETLVELQRSEFGGDLIDLGRCSRKEKREVSAGEVNKKRQSKEKFLEGHPFASCVARFAVQLEVGEGLRQRERRAFKQEIIKRVREVSVSDAEAATIVAEVLWGSSP